MSSSITVSFLNFLKFLLINFFNEILISLRWKISNQKLQNELEKESWYISSKKFDVVQLSGVEYYLEMQRKIYDDDEKVAIGLSIAMNKRKQKIKANFKISIPS